MRFCGKREEGVIKNWKLKLKLVISSIRPCLGNDQIEKEDVEIRYQLKWNMIGGKEVRGRVGWIIPFYIWKRGDRPENLYWHPAGPREPGRLHTERKPKIIFYYSWCYSPRLLTILHITQDYWFQFEQEWNLGLTIFQEKFWIEKNHFRLNFVPS